jgi:hypothetical protein
MVIEWQPIVLLVDDGEGRESPAMTTRVLLDERGNFWVPSPAGDGTFLIQGGRAEDALSEEDIRRVTGYDVFVFDHAVAYRGDGR